jgi:predicted DNA-binding transcriptional regulator AlpA
MTHDSSKLLVNTAQAAARIGVAEITLRRWRWLQNPNQPPFIRVGPRGVKYRVSDLDRWLDGQTHRPGSQDKNRSPSRQRRRPGLR